MEKTPSNITRVHTKSMNINISIVVQLFIKGSQTEAKSSKK